jgi:hypothetical protein
MRANSKDLVWGSEYIARDTLTRFDDLVYVINDVMLRIESDTDRADIANAMDALAYALENNYRRVSEIVSRVTSNNL